MFRVDIRSFIHVYSEIPNSLNWLNERQTLHGLGAPCFLLFLETRRAKSRSNMRNLQLESNDQPLSRFTVDCRREGATARVHFWRCLNS